MNKYIELLRPRHLIINATTFTIGSVLALKYGFVFNNNFFIGLIAFLIAYSGVYVFNDLTDVEHDKKHEIKWKRKRPLASGRVSIGLARKIFVSNLIIGLITSLFINNQFTILLCSIIIINLIYTKLRLKRKPIIGILMISIVQVIKFLLGWGALTTNYSSNPLLFFILYGLIYGLSTSIYKKKKFKNTKQYNIYLAVLSIIIITCYLTSIMIYPTIRLSLLLLILLGFIGGLIMLSFRKKMDNNFSQGLRIIMIFNTMIILSFIII